MVKFSIHKQSIIFHTLAGHLTYQCRNFITLGTTSNVVLDVSSTSSDDDDDVDPMDQLKQIELNKKPK